MKLYHVMLGYSLDGTGTTMTVSVYANSEFHACQVAQAKWPGMYALSASTD